MGVAPFLWRTIRTQRYRTQQTAKPQQTGKMTLHLWSCVRSRHPAACQLFTAHAELSTLQFRILMHQPEYRQSLRRRQVQVRRCHRERAPPRVWHSRLARRRSASWRIGCDRGCGGPDEGSDPYQDGKVAGLSLYDLINQVEGPVTVAGVVGRDREMAAVAAFLDAVPAGPAGLLLEGAAGIGKSTVWSAGAAWAAGRSFTVLSSRPAESEATLSFAALGDLLDGSSTRRLPRCRRRSGGPWRSRY